MLGLCWFLWTSLACRLPGCAETLAGAVEQKEVLVAEPAVQQQGRAGAQAELTEAIQQKVQLCDSHGRPHRAQCSWIQKPAHSGGVYSLHPLQGSQSARQWRLVMFTRFRSCCPCFMWNGDGTVLQLS